MMVKLVIGVILISLTLRMSECSLNLREDRLSAPRLLRNEDNQCPPWTYYNASIQRCKCYNDAKARGMSIVICNEQESSLGYNYCMTYDEESGTSTVSFCPYFTLQGHNISGPGLINLPDDISELNEYMCGPMNRKGIVCSECIDGYGPSVTSLKFRCSACSNVWYGVLIYLLIEIVPVTIFFITVLLFQLNLTTAPMFGFILYSNSIIILTTLHPIISNEAQAYTKLISLLYGIWTLDFFRFAIPPYCVSPKLTSIHIIYLQSVSTFFPYVLIAITWLLIKLHSNDCKVVVWMWKKLDIVILKHIKVQRNSGRTVIDAFATFFLLSFVKLFTTILLPLLPLRLLKVNSYNISRSQTIHSFVDSGTSYASGANLAAVVASSGIVLLVLFPPVFIIALYPIKTFRNLMLKCCHRRFICTLNFFVDKYHSCYKDGLDGGKDMRSFASVYFFMTILMYAVWIITHRYLSLAIVAGGYGFMIAIVQPYKKQYMTVIDSLLLANFALVTAMFTDFLVLSQICAVLPVVGLAIFICFRLSKKPSIKLYQIVKEKSAPLKLSLQIRINNTTRNRHNQGENGPQDENNEAELQLPDRVVHPEIYEQEETAY